MHSVSHQWFSLLFSFQLAGTKDIGNGNFQLLTGQTVKPIGSINGLDGFINCSQGGDEDGTKARKYLSNLNHNQIQTVTNQNYYILVTVVGNKPPFQYVYPGTNNPNSYDLWVDVVENGNPNTSITKEEQAWIEGVVTYSYGMFKDVVLSNRAIDEQYLDSSIFIGEQAINFNFADGILNNTDALNKKTLTLP